MLYENLDSKKKGDKFYSENNLLAAAVQYQTAAESLYKFITTTKKNGTQPTQDSYYQYALGLMDCLCTLKCYFDKRAIFIIGESQEVMENLDKSFNGHYALVKEVMTHLTDEDQRRIKEQAFILLDQMFTLYINRLLVLIHFPIYGIPLSDFIFQLNMMVKSLQTNYINYWDLGENSPSEFKEKRFEFIVSLSEILMRGGNNPQCALDLRIELLKKSLSVISEAQLEPYLREKIVAQYSEICSTLIQLDNKVVNKLKYKFDMMEFYSYEKSSVDTYIKMDRFFDPNYEQLFNSPLLTMDENLVANCHK